MISAVIVLGIFVLIFEFINGFHDTANAVATVIYTRSLKPFTAVVWAGVWNMIGVLGGGLAVAWSIMELFPQGLSSAFREVKVSFIISVLVAAILWNLYTWYKGLPCSSMHALIGAILGSTIAFSLFNPDIIITALQLKKLLEVLLSLLLSPLLGFALAYGGVALMKMIAPRSRLLQPIQGDVPPPRSIRAVLLLTCTAVSFAHGSNDGQKGVGLLLFIGMMFLPATFFASQQVVLYIVLVVGITLGMGTMIGWKRIVVTVGEKIGKHHMSYAQGAVAELVAAVTIRFSSSLGLPVSTTHVLSSGIAGGMEAKGGLKELQMSTVKNIGLAWVLTVPATVILGFVCYYIALLIL